jgi:hypothetical protein
LNNPRDNPAGTGSWFVNPFGGDTFPETPPPLAPGLLPEVDIRQFQAGTALLHPTRMAACMTSLCMHSNACMQRRQKAEHECRCRQGYLSRQAVAYEHFQAARADDGDRPKAGLAASGAPSESHPTLLAGRDSMIVHRTMRHV